MYASARVIVCVRLSDVHLRDHLHNDHHHDLHRGVHHHPNHYVSDCESVHHPTSCGYVNDSWCVI